MSDKIPTDKGNLIPADQQSLSTVVFANSLVSRGLDDLSKLQVIDAEVISLLVKIVAGRILQSGYTFAQWSKGAVDSLGDAVKPHLNAIWEEATAICDLAVRADLADKSASRPPALQRVYDEAEQLGYNLGLHQQEQQPDLNQTEPQTKFEQGLQRLYEAGMRQPSASYNAGYRLGLLRARLGLPDLQDEEYGQDQQPDLSRPPPETPDESLTRLYNAAVRLGEHESDLEELEQEQQPDLSHIEPDTADAALTRLHNAGVRLGRLEAQYDELLQEQQPDLSQTATVPPDQQSEGYKVGYALGLRLARLRQAAGLAPISFEDQVEAPNPGEELGLPPLTQDKPPKE